MTELGTAMTTAIKAFAVTGGLAYKLFWAKHYHAGIPGMDTTTTSSAEAMNSSIKSGVLATKPQYSIAKSATMQVVQSMLCNIVLTHLFINSDRHAVAGLQATR